MTPTASELASQALDGPVYDRTITHGNLQAFFPAPQIITLDGMEVEMVRVGVGPVLVNNKTGEVTRLGSLIFDWPEWVREG